MDVYEFTHIYKDKNFYNFQKMMHKYSKTSLQSVLEILQTFYYVPLPLLDFSENNIMYNPTYAPVPYRRMKSVFQETIGDIQEAREEEIFHSLRIEQVPTEKERVHKILQGEKPSNKSENMILGMEKGYAFIADKRHNITEENLFTLYQLCIGGFLPKEDQLEQSQWYRTDEVYVVGSKVVHKGLPSKKLPLYMAKLIAFIQEETNEIDDFHKACILHFTIAYLHPYFDGNGRMARLLHIWFLVQRGYSCAIFLPLSKFIEERKEEYYRAFQCIERNYEKCGILDITPFLMYFNQYVYYQVDQYTSRNTSMQVFLRLCKEGGITKKEIALWQFVNMTYGKEEFSTKQLEQDYGQAAYATIRGFVLKFSKAGLLKHQAYGNRNRYSIL